MKRLAKTKPFGIAFTLYPADLVKEVRPTLLAMGFAALFLLLILTVTPTIAGFQHAFIGPENSAVVGF